MCRTLYAYWCCVCLCVCGHSYEYMRERMRGCSSHYFCLSSLSACSLSPSLPLSVSFSLENMYTCVHKYVYVVGMHNMMTKHFMLNWTHLYSRAYPFQHRCRICPLLCLHTHDCKTTYIHALIELSKHITSMNHVCTYAYVRLYIYIQICIIYIYIYIYIHTHTYIYILIHI